MDQVDYRLVGITILIILGGLLTLLLVSLAIRRGGEILAFGYVGRSKNKTLARFSLYSSIVGIGFLVAFGVGGGAHGAHVINIFGGYLEALAAAFFLFIGVILTFFVKVPRPAKDLSLRQKVVQHAYFAWPWRHKWVFVIAAIIILLTGIVIYNLLPSRL